MSRHAQPARQRFWGKVTKTETCWIWTAARDVGGYGIFWGGPQWRGGPGVTFKAHRFAYETLRGPIPAGMVVDHLCRNPACVNPDHLEIVTIQENSRRAGRRHPPAGQPSPLLDTLDFGDGA